MDFVNRLLGSGTVRAYILAGLRHAATGLGLSLTAWLVAHNADPTQASALSAELVGVVVAGVSVYFSMQDVKSVDKKIEVAIAAAPDTPKEAIDALAAGKM